MSLEKRKAPLGTSVVPQSRVVHSRYHIGSVAFGGFIVAVIQFVRLLLEYVDRKSKKMQRNNPAARWLMCCLRYCLWCAAPLPRVQ